MFPAWNVRVWNRSLVEKKRQLGIMVKTYVSLTVTKMPLTRCVDKWAKVYPDPESHSGLKRSELSGHEKAWRRLQCRLLSEGNRSEKAASCMILLCYRTFWKRQHYKGRRKIRGWDEQVQHRGIGGQWKHSVWFCKAGDMSLCICQNP